MGMAGLELIAKAKASTPASKGRFTFASLVWKIGGEEHPAPSAALPALLPPAAEGSEAIAAGGEGEGSDATLGMHGAAERAQRRRLVALRPPPQ